MDVLNRGLLTNGPLNCSFNAMSREFDKSSHITLPNTPKKMESLPVAAWEEAVVIDTYLPIHPEPFPMFFEKRVYQGSSGKVYPLQFFNRVEKDKIPKTWRAFHLENSYVRLMLMPELGGRIHIGLDKTNGYDFIYRNNVIKPALVGLAGPWISGGIEFNWPQHHRPGTFLPLDCEIEEHEDGSRTIWCSDRDPFNGLSESHGITLRPESSLIEIKVRLNNPTELRQTFLWWMNMAVSVNDNYQSFFPDDVKIVADHAKRAITGFPRATDKYYGIDYESRVTDSEPDADRLDWYKNIPVPTSYMCLNSKGDFFGGYDHGKEGGLLHWADHRFAPGKKQWTWGNSDFGKAWERNLTDSDGPYVELMAGVFTDNQPDFSFLEPGETKNFSQYIYPIQKIGSVKFASRDFAVNLTVSNNEDCLLIGVGSSRSAKISISLQDDSNNSIWKKDVTVSPGEPFLSDIALQVKCDINDLKVVISENGDDVLQYGPNVTSKEIDNFEAARAPGNPEDIQSVEELYLIGQHLSQYRHATRPPLPYWMEALSRDPLHTNSLIAIAELDYRLGKYDEAKEHLLKALKRLTQFNPNPVSGEVNYLLGLTYRKLNQNTSAFDSFAKSAWDQKFASVSLYEMAKINCLDGEYEQAILTLNKACKLNDDFVSLRCLRALSKRALGLDLEFKEDISDVLRDFPRDWNAKFLSGQEINCDLRTKFDIAMEFASAGFYDDAREILHTPSNLESEFSNQGVFLLSLYYEAWLCRCLGDRDSERVILTKAKASNKEGSFPHGLNDLKVLLSAISAEPTDSNAHALLGNLYYSSKSYDDAIHHWTIAVELNPNDSISLRNLAAAQYNINDQPINSLDFYDRAIIEAPESALLIYERDQLTKRMGFAVADRLSYLKKNNHKIYQRDDLHLEFISLLLLNSFQMEALREISSHQFQPWEGGEGKALNLWERINLHLSSSAISAGDLELSRKHLLSALTAPVSLGEDHHPLANRSDIFLLLGDNLKLAGDDAGCLQAWTTAANSTGDFLSMKPMTLSYKSFYSIEALERLGLTKERSEMIEKLTNYAQELLVAKPDLDFFATSLPRFLLFKDNLHTNQQVEYTIISAQLNFLNGDSEIALKLLSDLLRSDPANEICFDLLIYMGSESELRKNLS